MYCLTVRELWAHKLRFMLTGLAVVLGVAFMAGTMVLTDTMGKTFDGLFESANADVDVLVQQHATVDATWGEVRERIPADALETVRSVDGVEAAAGSVQGFAQLVKADGSVAAPDGLGMTIGANWVDESLNPFDLASGSAPDSATDAVIDQGTADREGWTLGDTVSVLTNDGPRELTVVGTATMGELEGIPGSSVIAVADAAAQDMFGQPGYYDSVVVAGSGEIEAAALATKIDVALGDGTFEVLTAEADTAAKQNQFEEDLSFFNQFLMAFAYVSLFVGTFIIYNTFSIVVAQRSKDMAMLRAIGASRRQVARATRVEALVTGVLASALGVVLGIGAAVGLRALLAGFGLDLPEGGLVVNASTVAICMGVGVLVTFVAAIVPARRAAKVAPIAAMRGVAVDRSGRSVIRAVVGGLVTALGVAALALGLSGGDAGVVGLGALVVFLGVGVLGPVIARPVSRLLGAPLPRLRGVTGTMARENAIRNPKRTSATASALMVGLGLVVFITVFSASARASIADSVDTAARAEGIVHTTFGQGGLSPEAGEAVAELPEVEAMSPMRYSPALVDGAGATLSAMDPAQIDQVVDLAVTDGTTVDLAVDEIAVNASTAEEDGILVGDELTVEFARTGAQAFRVAAIYHTLEPMGPYTMSLAAFDANAVERVDSFLFMTNADGVSMDEARAAIESALREYPTAELFTTDEFAESRAAVIGQMLNLIYALLVLAVLIALFGVANTLALSVHERTRELGLLRAVGMARSQVRAMVRWESVIIALLGTVLGLVIGLGFAWALVDTLGSQGFEVLSVPVTQLAVITALAAFAGVVVALLPARKAARVPVLEALRTS